MVRYPGVVVSMSPLPLSARLARAGASSVAGVLRRLQPSPAGRDQPPKAFKSIPVFRTPNLLRPWPVDLSTPERVHRENSVTAALPQDPIRTKQKALLPFVTREVGPFSLAVTVGFEPTLALTPNNISSVAPSAARTRHQPD
jgi:hypothetical protein